MNISFLIKMSNDTSFKVLKIVTVIILIGLFIWNSIIVFKYFIAAKKVTSGEDKSNKALVPPALFVCREVAFTDDMKDMAKLDDFFDNTLNLSYEFSGKGTNVSSLKNNGVKNRPKVGIYEYVNTTYVYKFVNASDSDYSTDFKIEHVYSYSRGLCYKFLFLRKVKPYDIVNLYIYPNEGKENEDLEIFVTEPGEEYYVHMYLWRTNPFSFKLDAKVEAVDLTLKKVESHRDTDCNADGDYDYIGCIKSAYQEHCVVGNEFSVDGYPYTYPNCTMPWQQSMLNKHWSSTYNQDPATTCNQTQRTSLYFLDYEFLKQAAVLNITSCQAPCKTTTYDAGILKFQQDPYGVWHNKSKTNSTSFKRTVAMYFTTTDVTTYTEARLIDFSGFVSAVGGNLGLFLGFSFLGMLFDLYDYIENSLSSKLSLGTSTKKIQVLQSESSQY